MWLEDDLSINHTYWEKEMRTQLLIPERSAKAVTQKINILSNELIRRLSNVNLKKVEEGEIERIVDHMTTQLKGAGYTRRQSWEIIMVGMLGWMRKKRRRQEEGRYFYRGPASTLRQRMRKKLLDPVNWYKEKKRIEGNELEEEKPQKMSTTRGLKRKKIIEEKRQESKRRKDDPKAVIFCPYTHGGELAKQLQELETDLERTTGYRVKVVEEA